MATFFPLGQMLLETRKKNVRFCFPILEEWFEKFFCSLFVIQPKWPSLKPQDFWNVPTEKKTLILTALRLCWRHWECFESELRWCLETAAIKVVKTVTLLRGFRSTVQHWRTQAPLWIPISCERPFQPLPQGRVNQSRIKVLTDRSLIPRMWHLRCDWEHLDSCRIVLHPPVRV